MDACLAIRHQFKETIRARMRKENPAAASFKANADNYGSFFGPSETVIADSVILKIQSLSQNPKSAFEKLGGGKKLLGGNDSVRALIGKKEQQKKVLWLRETRDYSFLSSGSDEVPGPVKKAETVSRPEFPQAKKKTEVKKPVRRIKPENNSRAAGKKETQVSRDLKKSLETNKEKQTGQEKRGIVRKRRVEEEEDWRKEMRSVTGYDPTKYRDEKDDVRMETGFHDQQKEERRSGKIAKKEDAEELRKEQAAISKKQLNK